MNPFGPLFDLCDPSVTPTEAPRLSAQCQAILDRLQTGPASNKELSSISLKYTGRISDLRKNGYEVSCFCRDHSTGVSWYRLEVA